MKNLSSPPPNSLAASLKLATNDAEADAIARQHGQTLRSLAQHGAALHANTFVTMTFGEAIDKLRRQHEERKLTKKSKTGADDMSRHWLRVLGPTIRCAEVSEDLPKNAFLSLDGRPLAEHSVKKLGIHLRSILRAAGIVDPLPRLYLPRRPKKIAPAKKLTLARFKLALEQLPEELLAYFIVKTLGAVRGSTADKVTEADFDLVNERLILRGERTKSGKPKTLEDHIEDDGLEFIIPKIIFAFVARYGYHTEPAKAFALRLRRIFGGEWQQGWLRRTGASVDCAIHGIHHTRVLLTHADMRSVYRYIVFTTQAEAKEFLALLPGTFPRQPPTSRSGQRVPLPQDLAVMQALLDEKSLVAIGRDFGCSAAKVSRHAKKLGASLPGPSYWWPSAVLARSAAKKSAA